jgi:hypothetical protein
MKTVNYLLLLALSATLLFFAQCKKDNEQLDPIADKEVRAEKTNVKTYEIINLISYENLADKYNATFGSAAIELLKTSDSTLTFYVPDIPEGEASLEFELATIKFNVTKTAEVSASQLITNFTQNFDVQVSSLNPTTPDQITEINSLNQYKQEVISLFNSLSDEEKRQAVLFYEANKEIFQSFANSTFANLDASTTMRLQSECPRTDFNSFYGCTAENLGDAAIGLKNASKEFLTMLALAGVSAYLAPASFGLSAFGTTLALGTAGYLLITEVRPAAQHFKHSLFPFLEANWIFSKALFIATTEVFQDQISTSLNLTPKFRTLTSNDANINSGSGYFISKMSTLSEYWNKLTAIFGNFPTYKNTEETTTLTTNDVSISNISNPNVQYLGNTGQSVKFKSLSGNEENFSYNVRVTKEGFVEEKTLNGVIKSGPDTDKDGVSDMNDNCPTTPTGTKVDSVGCSNCPPPIIVLTNVTCSGFKLLIEGTYTGELSTDPFYDIKYDFIDNPSYSNRYLVNPAYNGATYHRIIVDNTNKTFSFSTYDQTCGWWAASTVKVSLRLISSSSNCNKDCFANNDNCFDWIYDWSNESSIIYTQ